jgi:hypothetical protein
MRDQESNAFTRLLENYCRSLGMGDFEIGPDGGDFDVDDVTISMRHDVDFGRLAMAAPVTTLLPEQIEEIAPTLLQLNAALGVSGGFAFCMDSATGALQLQQSAPLGGLDVEQIDSQLAAMVEKCRTARDLIATLNEGPVLAENLLELGRQSEASVTLRP